MASKGSNDSAIIKSKDKSGRKMNKIVLEKISTCKFVRSGSTPNGHDCWGNSEYSSYDYVIVDGKEESVFDSSYIIHDDENVLGTGSLSLLDSKLKQHLDKNHAEKLKEKRYERYLELDEEFGNDPMYTRDKKISKIIR